MIDLNELYQYSKEQWTNYAEEAYNLGFKYEKNYHGCGQCTIAAVFDTLNINNDAVFQSATVLAGGLGLFGKATCSALTGAALIFGLIYPRRRENFDGERENKYRTYSMAQEMHKRYLMHYGSIICHDIHLRIMGRSFDLRRVDERKCFEKAGAHDNKCPKVVALASKWAVEIIGEELMKDEQEVLK